MNEEKEKRKDSSTIAQAIIKSWKNAKYIDVHAFEVEYICTQNDESLADQLVNHVTLGVTMVPTTSNNGTYVPPPHQYMELVATVPWVASASGKKDLTKLCEFIITGGAIISFASAEYVQHLKAALGACVGRVDLSSVFMDLLYLISKRMPLGLILLEHELKLVSEVPDWCLNPLDSRFKKIDASVRKMFVNLCTRKVFEDGSVEVD